MSSNKTVAASFLLGFGAASGLCLLYHLKANARQRRFESMFTGMTTSIRPRPNRFLRREVNKVCRLIENCPDWCVYGEEKSEAERRRQTIMATLERLRGYHLGVVRHAVNDLTLNPRARFNMDSRLFLVNRYICNVPEWVPKGSVRPPGGFMVWRTQDDKVNLLWPLSYDEQGNVVLSDADYYIASQGSPYDAYGEFHFLMQLYGPRFPYEHCRNWERPPSAVVPATTPSP